MSEHAAERDPRVDPQTGDCVVDRYGRKREVITTYGSFVAYRRQSDNALSGGPARRARTQLVFLSDWRRWCRQYGAEVIARSGVAT